MNRRSFLGLLGAASAGFALDPERLLWVPGQKTIFIPALPALASHVIRLRTFVDLKQGDAVTWRRDGGTGRIQYVGVQQSSDLYPPSQLCFGVVVAKAAAGTLASVQSTERVVWQAKQELARRVIYA